MKCITIGRRQLMTAIAVVLTLTVLVAGGWGVLADSGRKLPIYCVSTTEKKIAISFDAAWGEDKKVQNNI